MESRGNIFKLKPDVSDILSTAKIKCLSRKVNIVAYIGVKPGFRCLIAAALIGLIGDIELERMAPDTGFNMCETNRVGGKRIMLIELLDHHLPGFCGTGEAISLDIPVHNSVFPRIVDRDR